MHKPSEDHLYSGACAHGQLQGQRKEATATKIGMGKLLLLIGTIITTGIIILRFDLISCLTLFTESEFLGVRYAKHADKWQICRDHSAGHTSRQARNRVRRLTPNPQRIGMGEV